LTRWILEVAVATLLTLLCTIPLRLAAVRLGIMDRPGYHKIHQQPVPYLGGVAVLIGVAVTMLLFDPGSAPVVVLIGLMAAIGLYDDIWYASVAFKVVGELGVATAAAALGFVWHITDSGPIDVAISLIWIVGLSNAYNLLDNMDGLASTVASAGLLGLAILAPSTAALALAGVGALVGFLVVNWPPARMYLGDSGSLLVGFMVALATISAANTMEGLHSVVLAIGPAAVGLMDTSLVIVSRLMTGRPIQLGGRDHLSHRLRILGWSRVQVLGAGLVATVWGLAITYFAYSYPLPISWLALPLGLAAVGAWLRLLRVDPYSSEVGSRPEVFSA
jgi:UDP-GlcNAc:undecaprenyl-phosphate GlcNAc-1-phosphate transferase